MIKLNRRERAGAEIPTASMADISFLLLLFFLVTTTIDIDTGIGLNLPEYVPPEEKRAVAPISKDRFVALLINANGDVLLNKELISIPQIRKTLKPQIESKIDLPANKKLVISIKTDRKTSYNRYIQALDQVKAAYYEVQEQFAMNKFGKKLYQLNERQKKIVSEEKIPITISIAEPEVVTK